MWRHANLIAICLLASIVDKARADQENYKEYKDMCALYRLLSEKVPDNKINTDSEDVTAGETAKAKMAQIVQSIIRLNLTVANDHIVRVLSDKKKYTDGKAVKSNNEVKVFFENIDAATIDKMFGEYAKLSGETKDKGFAERFKLPVENGIKAKLQPVFNFLASEAEATQKKLAHVVGQTEQLRRQARRHMLKALYGAAYVETLDASLTGDSPAAEIAADKFPWDGSNDRDTNCQAASDDAKKAGHCLAHDIICLCVNSHNADNKYCLSSGIENDDYSGNTAKPRNAAATWNRLKASCDSFKETATEALTSARLRHATTEILADLGRNWVTQAGLTDAKANGGDRTSILGFYVLAAATPAACASPGSSPIAAGGKGICIDYSPVLKKGKQIPWIHETLEAADALQKLEEIRTREIAFLTKAESIENQMASMLLMRSLLSPLGAKLEGKPGERAQPTAEDKNKCKAATNKTAEGCAEIACDYDENKKECKPKTETETTAAGTGETSTGAAAGVNCASHNDKTKCEEENKGKTTPVCGWRKGKDGEPDQDKEMCRNGSFLVNKKFALMVSAFVALLF
uniref:Variant surface glycoprotein n=1 Tax=Trypanosoma brucei TaxID=5691 RepID=A0A1V0FZ31_9TRYP|nr:variant surface glycoprotein [Trypanosoma brucei]